MDTQSAAFYDYLQATLAFLSTAESRLLGLERELGAGNQELWEIALREQQPSFDKAFDEHLTLLNKHAALIPSSQREREGKMLRTEIRRYIDQAPILHRTSAKPRGYQGDSEMMRMVYSDDWEGQTMLGRLLHKYSMSQPACQAIRNRRSLIASQLRSLTAARPENDTIRVLSVACGPAQEIADIFLTASDMRRFDVTLLDQDRLALVEAKRNMKAAERLCDAQASVHFVQESIAIFLKHGIKQEPLGQFEFIYSMGLYDYLPDTIARRLTGALFAALKPGGTLLLGNYSPINPHRMYMEYWCDWPLVYRTEEQLRSLLEPNVADQVAVGYEPSGTQLFLRATKSLTTRTMDDQQLNASL